MQPGELLAERFEIERLAGTGGMGRVYRARDREAGATVALKVLAAHADPERFAREARVLAAVAHPGIVRYVAHGRTVAGESWLAMEWLEGETVAERLASGPMSVSDACRLGHRVATTLGALHAHGIVHRDLKPSNLLLPGGEIARVKLLDFGIVRRSHGTALTATGAMLGTPGYMAPEQARASRDVDARADVFSLGCVLYKCLTGRAPFTGEDLLAVLLRTMMEEPPRLQEIDASIPGDLDDLVARMLSKARDGRPLDGAEVATELAAFQSTPPSLPATSRTQALGSTEQRVLCLVLVRLADSAAQTDPAAAEDTPASILGRLVGAGLSDHRVAELRAEVERWAGRLDALADGSLVVTLVSRGAATDLAAQAARCALSLQRLLAPRAIAIATRHGVVATLPIGEAIDRAVGLSSLRPPGSPEAGSPPGSIRLDDTTAGLLDVQFEIAGDARGLVLLRERDVESPRTLLGKPMPCIGREREIATLASTFAECVEGSLARAVLVTGPAGVGKSRLRHELVGALRSRALPVQIWTGRGEPMSRGPFTLLGRMLRRTLGIADGEPLATRQMKLNARVARHVAGGAVVRVAEFLGELIGAPFPDDRSVQLRLARRDATLRGDQMRRAWEDFAMAECSATPVLLVLEDLHWSDLPSVAFVESALRHLHVRPLMVLALGRPEVLELFPDLWAERGVRRIELSELDPGASAKLVRRALGPEVDRELLGRIVELSEGNAFYLEEIVRAVAARGAESLPATVLAMARSRLDALDPALRKVLRAASVFGQTFWAGGVAALLGGAHHALVGGWLRELVAAEAIVPRRRSKFPGEEELAFRHALLHDAARAMLTDADLALGHRLAGRWLERAGEGDALALAEHFERGGEPERALPWRWCAAEQALEGNDFAGAIQLAEHVITAARDDERRGAARLLQAEAHRWRGDLADAERRSLEALELLPRTSVRWYHAVSELIIASGKLGHTDRIEAVTSGLGDEPAEDDAAAARGMAIARASRMASLTGRLARADDLLARLEGVAARFAGGDLLLAARVHAARASRTMASDPEECLGLLRCALSSLDEAGDVRAACVERTNTGHVLYILGRYEEAEGVFREALADAERMALHAGIAIAKENLAITVARLGRLAEARELLAPALQFFAAHGERRLEGGSRIYLAIILGLQGDLEGAEREARAAALVPLPSVRAFACSTLARCLVARGRATEALAAAREAVDVLSAVGITGEGEATVRLAWAEALHATGDLAGAREAAADARRHLLARAERIDALPLRATFLTCVPENARTLALAESWTAR